MSWVVWSVGVLAYVLTVMQRTTLGVAGLDAAQHLGVSPGTLSLFVFVQVAVYMLAQLPAGFLTDRSRRARHARRQLEPARGGSAAARPVERAAPRPARPRAGRGRRRDRLRRRAGAAAPLVPGPPGADGHPADHDPLPGRAGPLGGAVPRAAARRGVARPRSARRRRPARWWPCSRSSWSATHRTARPSAGPRCRPRDRTAVAGGLAPAGHAARVLLPPDRAVLDERVHAAVGRALAGVGAGPVLGGGRRADHPVRRLHDRVRPDRGRPDDLAAAAPLTPGARGRRRSRPTLWTVVLIAAGAGAAVAAGGC